MLDLVDILTDASITDPDDYWQLGYLVWLTGDNAGLRQDIKTYTQSGGTFKLFLPMPIEIQISDLYRIWPGCDKRFATCRDKFDNVVNFRGEPHVPGNDRVFDFPDARA